MYAPLPSSRSRRACTVCAHVSDPSRSDRLTLSSALPVSFIVYVQLSTPSTARICSAVAAAASASVSRRRIFADPQVWNSCSMMSSPCRVSESAGR